MSSERDSQTKSEVDLCIFHDIFRRADKNDDGAISWTEFASYFSDGIVTDDGMRSLFNEIDTHHTNNIDTQELCSYFSERLGSHEPVFQAAASLCNAVSASVKCLADTHAKKSPALQFVDRFLLRELCAHLEAQLQVLRNAHESLRKRARDLAMPQPSSSPPPPPRPPPPQTSSAQHQPHKQDSIDSTSSSISKTAVAEFRRSSMIVEGITKTSTTHQVAASMPPVVDRDRGEMFNDEAGTEASSTVDGLDGLVLSAKTKGASTAGDGGGDGADAGGGGLRWEVGRLQRLLDRLESRTALVTGGRIEETAMDEEEPVILIVRHRVAVPEEQLGEFKAAVKKYSASMESVTSCLFLSVRHYRETGCVLLYEFWESLGSWRKFLPSPASKALRRAVVDCAEAPETMETLLLPSEWWKNLER